MLIGQLPQRESQASLPLFILDSKNIDLQNFSKTSNHVQGTFNEQKLFLLRAKTRISGFILFKFPVLNRLS